jgi:hypothetical protein
VPNGTLSNPDLLGSTPNGEAGRRRAWAAWFATTIGVTEMVTEQNIIQSGS